MVIDKNLYAADLQLFETQIMEIKIWRKIAIIHTEWHTFP